MEVTHREDKVTHAVITAHRAMDIQVSDDASFLHTLTATLYSDQKGAVVREILCNAWDAHKAAGRTHIPVKVTLNHESMIFEDKGLGIPPGAEMLKIYGTFGSSTKRNDGQQTGGFGLGSKAPWAYADQFTVTSSHKGMRHIYNMSKSSAEVGGKPSIIPITSFPTQEEGVIVSVPIKGSDFHAFKRLIEKFTLYGDMLVDLNGARLQTIPFNSIQEKYVVTDQLTSTFPMEKVLVRYGDVIYPLGSQHELFVGLYRNACDVLYKLGSNWKLVLLAEPNTISVTPSRESLSMQTHTATTVARLLNNFLYKVQTSPEAKTLSERVLLDGLKKINLVEGIPGLLNLMEIVPGVENVDKLIEQKKIVHEPEIITQVVLKRHYPKSIHFKNLDIETRLKYLIRQGIGNKGLVSTFMKEWHKQKLSRASSMTEWFHRRVLGPARRRIQKSKTMKESRLFVVGHRNEFMQQGYSAVHSLSDDVNKASEIQEDALNLKEYIPYLRNIVVLSYTKKNSLNQLLQQKPIVDKYGKFSKFILYVCPRSQAAVEEARKLLGSMNCVFVDLTKGIDLSREKADKKARLKKDPGHPILEGAMLTGGNKLSMTQLLLSSAKRSDKPEFFLLNKVSIIRESSHQMTVRGWLRLRGIEALTLFGSKGVLITTEIQKEKMLKNGIPSAEDYVLKKVHHEITTNPIYKEYSANNYTHLRGYMKIEAYSDLEKMLSYRSIREHFGVQVNLTEHQKMYLALAKQAIDYLEETIPEIQEMTQILERTALSKALIKVADAVKKSTMLHWVDVQEVASTIAGEDQQKAVVALSLLKYALKS